ncbi:Shiga toxin A subunit [Erwinia sp. MMLR14_017]|uniref:Shiga toxin A subunit n=1 Tax=Erwinia sp. MMLR14_017 TaxID=3093842 RepID=UPI00298F660E|nr:Shiga toxin A subunit [Erwinia sp. MMLR14_017]MDW8844413.1 Shiga toxin A subunit [Erwinia sp. MMLR14_017]
MIKRVIYIIITLPFFSYGAGSSCAVVGASMEQYLFDSVVHDLNIDGAVIERKETKVQIINISPVSDLFAEQLAKTDGNADKNKKALLKEGDYFESYYTNGAKTITAKYIYFNNKNKKNIFIASSIMNNDECSVRFNGYLTLSREF